MLAEVVQQHRERVLALARRRLGQMVGQEAATEGQEYLSELLDELVAGLTASGDGGPPAPRIEQTAAQCGWKRQEHGAAISLIAHDFGVICDAVAQLADETATRVDPGEWQALNRAVDSGIAAALSAYEKQRQQREQDERATRLGAVAHELRNALGAASTGFTMIKQRRVGTDSRTADLVTRNLGRAAILANSLIAESRLDAAVQPSLAPLRLRLLIDDIVGSLTTGAVAALSVDAAPELTVMADEQLLISALTNLIQNAVKFTRPEGSVFVRARPDGPNVVIEVEDECGGLPPGTAERIFTPFVQQGANRTGAGLGLTIVRKVAVAHRGSVRVVDLPGRGCVFELRIPASAP